MGGGGRLSCWGSCLKYRSFVAGYFQNFKLVWYYKNTVFKLWGGGGGAFLHCELYLGGQFWILDLIYKLSGPPSHIINDWPLNTMASLRFMAVDKQGVCTWSYKYWQCLNWGAFGTVLRFLGRISRCWWFKEIDSVNDRRTVTKINCLIFSPNGGRRNN